MKLQLLRTLVVALLFVTSVLQETQVLAGTTGALSGTVVETSNRSPIPDAKVTVTAAVAP